PAAVLEQQAPTLARIVALWPAREVLEVIEDALFRPPGLGGGDPMGLEGYRELVLLYQIAREVGRLAAAEDPGARQQPGPAGEAGQRAEGAWDPLLVPPASPRVGVDIDLGS